MQSTSNDLYYKKSLKLVSIYFKLFDFKPVEWKKKKQW